MAIVRLNGKFLAINPALCRIVGYTESELFALTFRDLTHPEDLEASLANVQRMISGEISTYETEKRYFRKDGTIVCVLVSVSFPPAVAGSERLFLAQVQDITTRKTTEDCLLASLETKQRLYEQLRQVNEEIARLQSGLVTICAWTKQIRCGKEWKSVEQFLTEHLHLKLSHGVSEQAAENMCLEMDQQL